MGCGGTYFCPGCWVSSFWSGVAEAVLKGAKNAQRPQSKLKNHNLGSSVCSLKHFQILLLRCRVIPPEQASEPNLPVTGLMRPKKLGFRCTW